MVLQIQLTPDNSQRAGELSRKTGMTPEQLVNQVFERFADVTAQDDEVEHRKFLAWREALLGIEGMWADRDDLPDFQELRKTWDRNLWSR